ncbi:MAG TPA: BolA family protein [Burkholderiales bacterium]|jgi:BolA family transcriptional regulator, general stress-responsive regulator|nr:BolA family protein [Burkholderiales bacterium]
MSIERLIREKLAVLQPESLEFADDSELHRGHVGAQSGGGHYRLTIVSPLFSGKNSVARHRMVYAALGPLMQREIHALAVQAKAPGEQ